MANFIAKAAGSLCKHRLFASLTLRAARNYVRYSAALRSYSGFVEMTKLKELSRPSQSNQRSS